MTYFASLAAPLEAAITSLKKHGVEEDKLRFGGETPVPAKIYVPSFADSKFQAEQALGDWAENSLAAALNEALPNHRAVAYGFSSKIIAGEDGFKEHYVKGIADTCLFGKRADLLIVDRDCILPDDISNLETVDLSGDVAASMGAIEVRSSRMESKVHAEYVISQLAAGKKVSTPELNFTVKVEDLIKVYRWIEVHDKPQLYAQVFLDAVYAIGIREILEYIGTASKLKIDNPQRSRKYTIMVPISTGHRVGDVVEYPNFEVVDRLTKNGRHDIYARPVGGKLTVNGDFICDLLQA
ncbi:AccI family restriction endonuclease [Sphingomonas montanisoli]|uniref:AccI family restriction endonuclease n=1 Tax=Sphingomonas montanisoli TaxID=2606412 RepID=A0A5D9CB08_9SPHN|nr:AccI family restriction endonuclease [Sphingomonas montanisoli]TZG29138.1 AccI family restriction endonuclease [Sphingomonas montanisoli]